MKTKLRLGRLVMVLACAASLAGTATAIAPSPPARAVTMPRQELRGETGIGWEDRQRHRESDLPAGWRRLHRSLRGDPRLAGRQGRERLGDPSGGANAPEGFIAEMAEKPGKSIKFAVPAG